MTPPILLSPPIRLEGIGLITGLPVSVVIAPAPAGHGIVFYLEDELPLPARPESIVHLDRGVTLGHPAGKTLSIVEHFLCACALAGVQDAKVSVYGAPELPILDGSAAPWLAALEKNWGPQAVPADLRLKQAVFYRHSDKTCLYALPAPRFQLTYAVDFPHPELQQAWARWQSGEEPLLAAARTFGLVRELPVLQAQGLARGVQRENTLGLTDDGGYTEPLRLEQEPIYHKMLDLIGDLTLCGLNPLRLQAHVFAINAGHSSHVPFGKRLLAALDQPA